jgi:hypothetical protein
MMPFIYERRYVRPRRQSKARNYRRRFHNQRERKKFVQGILVLCFVSVGGVVGGWGGAAIGLLIAGLVCVWTDEGKVT